MSETLQQGYEDAFRCCKEVAAIDPEEGIACFAGLVEWRTDLTQLIIAWYQACIDGNADLARDLFDMARSIFVSRFGDDCPTVAIGPDGQPRTVGLVFGWSDELDLRGRFLPVTPADRAAAEARVGPLDAALAAYAVEAGSFEAAIAGTTISGGLSGALVLGAARPDGARPIADLRLTFATGAGSVALALVSSDAALLERSVVRRRDGGLVLEAHVSLAVDDALPILAPPTAWIEFPLRQTANGFALGGGSHALRRLMPPSLGFADWNGDGAVGLDDWTAYFAAPAEGRDLDLDGDQDAQDDALFIASFRHAVPAHGS